LHYKTEIHNLVVLYLIQNLINH